MACYMVLRCAAMHQELKLELASQTPSMSSLDMSSLSVVYENGTYEIDFYCDEYPNEDINEIGLALNDTRLSRAEKDKDTKSILWTFKRFEKRSSDDSFIPFQPFLMQCDLVSLSVELILRDGRTIEYYSDYLLCVSKYEEDRTNIQAMLEDLARSDNSRVEDWLFTRVKDRPNALRQGAWGNHAYKSYSSYLQLLENVISCYRNNYTMFKALGRHTINKTSVLLPYNKVNTITVNSFQWLMQNADQLKSVTQKTGISHYGKNYIPDRIKGEISNKSWNTYENKVVVYFLNSVLSSAVLVSNELTKQVLDGERILKRINGSIEKGFIAPIITVKTIQITTIKNTSEKLKHILETLKSLMKQYSLLFDIIPKRLDLFPRKSKVFQEIRPYTQVFEMITRWFRYGEFDLAKENLLLQVKTLDKLFEYYCLFKILEMFDSVGYSLTNKDSFLYDCKSYKGFELPSETEIDNTYYLRRNDVIAILYYQPLIRNDAESENGIELYRTTVSKCPYWTPDFVLKFESEEMSEYVILDSKFSRRDTITNKNGWLQKVIRSYGYETAVARKDPPFSSDMPKMVFVLQGRVDNEKMLDINVKSKMAEKYHCQFPLTGVVSINSRNDAIFWLWREMKKCIPWI